MITKADLKKIKDVRRTIYRKKQSLRELEERVTSVHSSVPEGERVQTSPSNHQDQAIIDKVDTEREIEKWEDLLSDLIKPIEKYINSLEDERQKEVMYYRYVEGRLWEDVAVRTGYELSWVHRTHQSVLKHLN